MKPPRNATNVLKAEAKKLTDAIFRHRYCVVKYKNTGKCDFRRVEKHHLIYKSHSTRFKFNIWNILPVSDKHHRNDKDSAHENYDIFLAWVKQNLPLHWAWYQENINEPPHTLRTSDWSNICDDLRYYVNHPNEAEKIIYEK